MWGWLTKLSECDSLQALVTRTERFIRRFIRVLEKVYKSIIRVLEKVFHTYKTLIHTYKTLIHNYVKNSFIFIIPFKTYFLMNNVSVVTIYQ